MTTSTTHSLTHSLSQSNLNDHKKSIANGMQISTKVGYFINLKILKTH